jgi:LmbE family N-acetylglucosaminyl deacetylase
VWTSPLSAQDRGAALLGPLVQGLGVTTRVLVIAAHPDDEDTQLITWLARGRQVETAYLSLTRGDGGQNLVGNELGEALGAIRTEELLAARRLDGGRQYFTRAFDFGFSRNAEETLTQWSRDSILRDVITVVRAFRPHVIVSVFSGTPADGHGHHQVAGLLAREAYDMSGDTLRIPAASTAGFGPWTVAKFYRGALFRNQDQATIRFNVGEYSPLLGRSYAEIAADSRSQHKSQAMGALQLKGPRYDQLIREAARVGPADPRTERSIFDGIDTTWARFRDAVRTPGRRAALDSLPEAYAAARRSLDVFAPGNVLPALARIQRLLDTVCGAASDTNPCAGQAAEGSLAIRNADLHGTMEVASVRLQAALAAAAGISVEVTAPREVLALGEPVRIARAIYNRGNTPVQVIASLLFAGERPLRVDHASLVVPGDSVARDSLTLSLSQVGAPWWLAESRRGPMFAVPGQWRDEAGLRAIPSVRTSFDVAGARFSMYSPVTYRYADALRGEINLPVSGAPAITLTVPREVEYAPANTPLRRTITVEVRNHRSVARDVDVRLTLPQGLTADTISRRIRLPGAGATTAQAGAPLATLGIGSGAAPEVIGSVTFTIGGRLQPGRHSVRVTASSEGETYTTGYTAIRHDHIGTQRLFKPSTLTMSAVDVAVPRGMTVAYVPGVGDDGAAALQQLGVDVTVVEPGAVPRTDLRRYAAVVVGPRAYEASPELAANNARLLEYARSGGTLVVQYGQYEMLGPGMMPFPITLGRPADRVTVEGAPVSIADPAAPVLALPNRIGAADFAGWVQDRSLYMPRTFAAAYRAPLEMHDPGQDPNRGALLVAPYGRGTYVYTSLAFFRQLPAGVPGAARLFVNLLAARADRITQ